MEDSSNLSKIILGTAQFGMDYGVVNQKGKVKFQEAGEILDFAFHKGIKFIDTARGYGNAENLVGSLNNDRFNVITKILSPNDKVEELNFYFENSLSRLNCTSLYGVLIHDSKLLCGGYGNAILQKIADYKKHGFVSKVGVSIYCENDLLAIKDSLHLLDIIQAPYNLLDNWIVDSGWSSRLKQFGIEVHVRSIFLQGLLLTDIHSMPEKFMHWVDLWGQYEDWLNNNNLTKLQACLLHALNEPTVDYVVIGVDGIKHLNQIIEGAIISKIFIPPKFNFSDKRIINPVMWGHL